MSQLINRLQVGDTWSFATQVDDYSAADGWLLRIYLVPRFSAPAQDVITLDSVADDDGHLFQAAAGDTADYAPGQYGFYTQARKDADVYTLEGTRWRGEVTLDPDPAALAQGADTRTQAQKAIDDIKAALADLAARAANSGTSGSASGPVVEYQIGDRRVKYATVQEALDAFNGANGAEGLLAFWQRERARELRREALAKGYADPKFAWVRHVR